VKAFVVYWHPEPRSFNHAMFATVCEALAKAGAAVKTSDLRAMAFDSVSSRANFRTVRVPGYLKLQIEELHATEAHYQATSPEVCSGSADMGGCRPTSRPVRIV
jgi:NAD(P)H dehydrogenase (quinone)